MGIIGLVINITTQSYTKFPNKCTLHNQENEVTNSIKIENFANFEANDSPSLSSMEYLWQTLIISLHFFLMSYFKLHNEALMLQQVRTMHNNVAKFNFKGEKKQKQKTKIKSAKKNSQFT